MTHNGHRLSALAAALPLAISGQPLLAAGLLLGGNAPDWLELPRRTSKHGQRRLIPHRTLTHWPPLWLLLLFIIEQMAPPPLRPLATGFVLGGLLHLGLDSATPHGIPLLTPFGRRYSLGLYRTGGTGERVVLLVLFAASAAATLWLAGITAW